MTVWLGILSSFFMSTLLWAHLPPLIIIIIIIFLLLPLSLFTSSSHLFFFSFPSSQRLSHCPDTFSPVLISLCFFTFTTMLVCDWPRCAMWHHVPPTCPLASCLQWATLSGLWVWALPPQALQPLAGCTGAFPGQVPSPTCVPPPLRPS